MLKVNQHNLLQLLKNWDYKPQIQEGTNQIYLMLQGDTREYPLFIRVLDEGDLLQLLTFFPCNVKPSAIADMARLLHMLNKEIDLPGFCMDETSSTVFYRTVVPSLKGQLHEETLKAYIQTAERVCQSFSKAIEAVAVQAMSLEEILNKASQQSSSSKQA